MKLLNHILIHMFKVEEEKNRKEKEKKFNNHSIYSKLVISVFISLSAPFLIPLSKVTLSWSELKRSILVGRKKANTSTLLLFYTIGDSLCLPDIMDEGEGEGEIWKKSFFSTFLNKTIDHLLIS